MELKKKGLITLIYKSLYLGDFPLKWMTYSKDFIPKFTTHHHSNRLTMCMGEQIKSGYSSDGPHL